MHKILGKYISIISRNAKSYFRKELAHLNIGDGQYIILIQLFRKNITSQDTLAEILAADKATITRALKSLEKNGYVNIKKSDMDKRENIITLTSRAFEIKDEFFSIIRKWNEMLISDIDESDSEVLFRCIEKISEKAVKINKENKKHGKN